MRSRRRTNQSTIARMARPGVRGRAFTLIEVMLATVIGAMVISAAAVASVESLRAQQAARRLIRTRWADRAVLRQFEQDIAAEITWLPDAARTVKVPPESDRLLEIISLVDLPATDSMFRRRVPAKVSYVVTAAQGASSEKTLWRETIDLTQRNQEPVRRKLATRLSDVRIEAKGPKGWFIADGALKDRPEALRLVCRWAADPNHDQVRTVVLRPRASIRGNRQ